MSRIMGFEVIHNVAWADGQVTVPRSDLQGGHVTTPSLEAQKTIDIISLLTEGKVKVELRTDLGTARGASARLHLHRE